VKHLTWHKTYLNQNTLLMKKLLQVFIFFMGFFNSFSQSNDSAFSYVVADTFFTATGYKIIVGQDIYIGTGSAPYGDFKFIRRNSTGFGTVMASSSNHAYNNSQFSLPRNMAGHKGTVVKIAPRGNDDIGITYEPLITFGSGRYEIDVDNAIASGEIIVPEEFRPKPKVVEIKQQLSVADELIKLKKLLDDGVLTKDEFEALKKKLLEKGY
jgi:hypothetical protein